jgi:DNA gyrase subunit A
MGTNGQKITPINLADELKSRYLNYALSVVTSRALPDVRDGLKPVQRRILYAMYKDFHLDHKSKYRKSAAVVGRVIGTYHPHGDQSVYNAMVRMAQPFSLRYPLIEGHGNFGSLDGDPAAAYRYTEVRLQKISNKLLEELDSNSVETKTNFDGATTEPTVLPSQLPTLLINGISGIAVGMATNIPPHNLKEVINACIELIYEPNITTEELTEIIKGPDFPTGGKITTTTKEIIKIYETGRGAIKVQATYKSKDKIIIINSIPFGIDKTTIVEQIANIIITNKLPGLENVRDESSDNVRIVLEIKNTTPNKVMAYLFHHTQLQTNFSVNMMGLVPHYESVKPQRLNLKSILQHFLDFRLEILTNKLAHELRNLRKRIHILYGYDLIFEYIVEVFNIIRKSKNKTDALKTLLQEFELDRAQAQAILEMQLQRLVKIEKHTLLRELEQKLKKAAKTEALLADEDARWDLLADELEEIADEFGDKRQTRIQTKTNKNLIYDSDNYIKKEDTNIILTKDGWIKRVQQLKTSQSTLVHDGDEVISVQPGNTSACIAFFSNFGIVYVMRILDIPSVNRGYGKPIQTFFNLRDGERIISALSLDERITPPDYEVKEDEIPPPYMIAITLKGKAFRFPLQNYRTPTTKVGKMFCRPNKEDEIINVSLTSKKRLLALITKQGKGLLFPLSEISVITTSRTQGVIAIKLKDKDQITASKLFNSKQNDAIQIRINNNKTINFDPKTYKVTKRASAGIQIIPLSQKFTIVKEIPQVVELK